MSATRSVRASPAQSGRPLGVARRRRTRGDRRQRLVEDLQRPFHRDRFQPADAGVERVVEERQEQQHRHDHRRDRAHQHPLRHGALAAVGEEQHVDEDHAGDEEEDDPERRRDHADGAVDPVAACLLARRRLLEPLVVGGLLTRGLRLDAAHRAEQLQAPRGSGRRPPCRSPCAATRRRRPSARSRAAGPSAPSRRRAGRAGRSPPAGRGPAPRSRRRCATGRSS